MVIRIDEEKVKRIADYYGWNNQLKQLAEECSELSAESLHYIREGRGIERISEEIADVLIMVQQIIYLIGHGYGDIEKYAEFKLDRQLSRMEREQEQIQIAMFYDYDEKSKRVVIKIKICFQNVFFLYDKNILLERVQGFDRN